MRADGFCHHLLEKAGFQTLREVLLALHGKKISRICIHEKIVPQLVEELERCGLVVGLYNRKYILAEDQGKGGWVSGYGNEVEIESPLDGYLLAYVGKDAEILARAMRAEHSGDYAKFGLMLGYPPCCVDFYGRSLAQAENSQGDFLLQTLAASGNYKAVPIFPALCNVAAQYFDYGFLSFYPCSFFCGAALQKATEGYEILRKHDSALAERALAAAKRPLLYTEYEGIYAFNNAILKDKVLYYDNTGIEATLNGVLGYLLANGDRLAIENPHFIKVSAGQDHLATLRHPSLAMLVFE